jgi:hypothetical protein
MQKVELLSFSLHVMAIRFFTIECRNYHYHCIALLLANFDAKERPFLSLSATSSRASARVCPFLKRHHAQLLLYLNWGACQEQNGQLVVEHGCLKASRHFEILLFL